jgi:glycosyltransferase involved in cell wall biosynthesis
MSGTMKIAVVNNFFFPRVGGSAMISQEMAEYYLSQGHEVLVITGEYSKSVKSNGNYNTLKVERIRSWMFPKTKISFNFDINFCLLPGNRKKVNAILSEFKPDIVHLHGQFLDLTWKALKWCRQNSIPSVLTLHTRLYNPNRLINSIFWILDKVIISPILTINKPSRIVCIDSQFTQYVKKRYKTVSDRGLNIPVGVSLSKFLVQQPRLHRINRDPIIGSIGHIIAVRNRRTLFHAVSKLKYQFPGISVVVCGNDYLDPATNSLISKLGIEENIVFKGAVPHDDIPKILDTVDIEIHDTHGSGYNLSTIESMARGVPTIISSPLDYYHHANIKDRKNTLLINPEDVDDLVAKIRLLLEDNDLYAQISSGGMEFAESYFDLDRVSVTYLKIFFELISV